MKMLKKLVYIFLLVVTICATERLSAQSIKASLDSSQITMGYQTAIRFDIVGKTNQAAEVMVDKAQFPKEVDIVDWVYGDTADLGNGLVEMKRALIIQAFDSGAYTIPPFYMMGTNGDTLRTKELTLKVNPVDVSQMKDINPIADAMEFETKWYDWIPDWITDYWQLWIAAILLIAAGICAYLILTKKVDVPLIPKKKPIPPYQLALLRLAELKEANLWQSGQEKEYYTRLIDILRDYLQGRFGINAMEMTSQQITRILQHNEATRLSNERMKRILEIADMVKFAKVRPLPDDNFRAFNEATQFVEETKPVELPNPDAPASAAATAPSGSPATTAAPATPGAPKNHKE